MVQHEKHRPCTSTATASYLSDAWSAVAPTADAVLFDLAYSTALRLRSDPVVEGALDRHAARLSAQSAEPFAAVREMLFLDRLTRRLRNASFSTVRFGREIARREFAVLWNATRLALDGAVAVDAVREPAVISAVRDSDAELLDATLGKSQQLIRGRLDLIPQRRFGIWRVAGRPRVMPDEPLTTSTALLAKLHFLADEAEHVWLMWRKTTDRRIPLEPELPVSHRDARAITSWSAAALDMRLARGRQWDQVLDAARIRSGGGSRDEVLLQPRAFMEWWTALSN